MSKEKEITSLATTTKNFVVLREDASALREALEANLGTGGIGAFDLDRVKVPSGGGRTWTIPGLEETEAKFIDGVIVHWTEPRAYWSHPMEGEGTPPDCSSSDGVHGTGTPGGACAACPFNAFGTKGAGKACKQTRTLFILREGDRLPIVLIAPPGSLKNLKKFFLRLSVQAIPFFSVITRFELVSAKSKAGSGAGGGITYSQIAPSMLGRLEPSEVDKIRAYTASMNSLFAQASVIDIGDVSGDE